MGIWIGLKAIRSIASRKNSINISSAFLFSPAVTLCLGSYVFVGVGKKELLVIFPEVSDSTLSFD